METLEAIFTRRSVRSYKADPIPIDLIHKILEAGQASPSGGNAQAWSFIIVQSSLRLAYLHSLAPGIIGNPSTVLVICQDEERIAQFGGKSGDKSGWIDIGCATENILLAAHAIGLGACPIGSFHSAGVALLLNLPPSVTPVLMLALGYPERKPDPPSRRSISEFCYLEDWGRPI